LLENVTDCEYFFFSELWSHYLQTDRESERGVVSGCSVASRDRDAWDTCEGSWDGENICHIICERIIVHLTYLPCDHRGDRSCEDIDLCEYFCEFSADELSDERGAMIVGVIKTRGECKGTNHDSSLRFGTKSF
jgi:hypothetical protein